VLWAHVTWSANPQRTLRPRRCQAVLGASFTSSLREEGSVGTAGNNANAKSKEVQARKANTRDQRPAPGPSRAQSAKLLLPPALHRRPATKLLDLETVVVAEGRARLAYERAPSH
jgi:hypothetical protein